MNQENTGEFAKKAFSFHFLTEEKAGQQKTDGRYHKGKGRQCFTGFSMMKNSMKDFFRKR